MLIYIAKRVAGFVPMLLGISMICFAVMVLAPGSPVDLMTDMNPKASPEDRIKLEKFYGLDQPVHVQYGLWLKRVVQGDLGTSFSRDRRPVLDKILEALPITLMINVISLALILLLAIPIGVYSAARQHTLGDRITTVFVFLGFAVPDFWLVLLAMSYFGAELNLLPISGLQSLDHDSLSAAGKLWDWIQHLILPIGLSVITGLAGMSRYMRSQMLEVLRQDYIQTARAKGLDERTVVLRHGMRNALLPVITLLGLSLPGLIGGSVITEQLFSIPGMGRLFFTGVMSRDYPVVMGILMFVGVLTLIGNLLADLAYYAVDPRLRRR
jgi:peptide/nickel transport system permease protein